MSSKKKFLYIGNRPAIIKGLADDERIDLVKVFVPEKFMLFEEDFDGIELSYFSKSNAQEVIEFCDKEEFDVCISAGCPIILPRSSFSKDKVFINSHPSALPYGKGIHPINESVFSFHKKAGSTLHYLTDELDCGDIISQETFDVTPDIDVTLLYLFIFELEKNVVFKGIDKLFCNDFSYCGIKQKGNGTYYSRKDEDMSGIARNLSVNEFSSKVKAFSSKGLGFKIEASDKKYTVYNASVIFNEFVNDWYSAFKPGDIVSENEEVVLIKLKDGLVRLNSWKVI